MKFPQHAQLSLDYFLEGIDIWDLHIHRIPGHWDKRLWPGHFRLDNKPLYTKDILPMYLLRSTCIHICRSSNHIPDKLKLFSVYYATGKYTDNSNVCSCIWDLHIHKIPGRWDKRLWRDRYCQDNLPPYTKDILPTNLLRSICIHIFRFSNHIPDRLKLFPADLRLLL